ncbi:MAG: hypothetical protein U0935_09655 [Pirellulales bacterium]
MRSLCLFRPVWWPLVASVLMCGWLVAPLAGQEPQPPLPSETKDARQLDTRQLDARQLDARQLGTSLLERARQTMTRAKQAQAPEADRLHGEARALYSEGRRAFVQWADELKMKLAALPKTLDRQKDAARALQRDEWRADYLMARLQAAAVLEELADALDRSGQEYRDTLAQAAKEYGEIADTYRVLLAGLYARLFQGRALQKQGQVQEALRCHERLLDMLPDARVYQELKTKVLLLAIDCWLDESQKNYAEAVKRGRAWIDQANTLQVESDDLMALRLAVARGAWQDAEQRKKDQPDDPQIGERLNEARTLAQFVADREGVHQQKARQWLSTLPSK